MAVDSPAAANPDGPTKVSGPMTHPELDFAGSGVAEHEGGIAALMARPAGIPGLDVSGWQGNVNWRSVRRDGARFAYVKATESTTYRNPYFNQQYVGAYRVGLVRGAYHFALPDRSSGAAQARFFAANGGGWSPDNQTLPGALDIEYNPYGPTCYGKSHGGMVAWIRDFLQRYHALTGRWATIYTTTDWWKTCTGNHRGVGSRSPLWIARWASSVGELPAGWDSYTFWQWASQPGVFPGDQNVFRGSRSRLVSLANNTRVRVIRVVDGDTIRVRFDGKRRSVRLIGTDTPELLGECGGADAASSLSELLEPKEPVRLVSDPSQGRRDSDGRLLRYVEDGRVDVGRRQIRRGWAGILRGEDRFRRIRDYRLARGRAREHPRGVWRRCEGNFHLPLAD
jgi:GH25 family lysozyme M1 (1,4-beta-N-acetylmuramidase)/endonuclease YncB( thermonuclease family)